ncbi:MAG: 2,3-bisphosphoglycerate-independent phosphoglycerate mutase, partial [Thermoleophilia bacterium]|nr:2,3-bisphosphoglycerate-independent phosphoglycerate mutase [Thermoleophilia bacterium]
FFNFRPDRARQLTRALTQPAFDGFDRGPDPPVPHLVTLTRYAEDIAAPVAYPPEPVTDVLADAVAGAGLRQLHIAETEKYAHVTYFFDGGDEHRRVGEEWVLIPSPKHVPTYDHAPAMSAEALAERFCEELAGDGYAFTVINFANPDMVGHTGVIEAVVRAVEVVDGCLGRVVEAVHALGGVCVVTADHGNAEQLLAADGVSPHTAHTTNPVPVVVTAEGLVLREGGTLADLVPTCLRLLGIEPPAEMTGRSLVAR